MTFRFMLSIVFVIAVAVIGVAQEPKAKKTQEPEANKAIDPSGTWKWERTFGERQMDFTLRLKLNKNGKLTGNYATKRGETEREPAEIEDATINEDKLSFQVTRTRNDQEFTVSGVNESSTTSRSKTINYPSKSLLSVMETLSRWPTEGRRAVTRCIDPILNRSFALQLPRSSRAMLATTEARLRMSTMPDSVRPSG